MKDVASLQRANLLHPMIRQQVIDTITSIEAQGLPKNCMVRIVQGLRTIEEQNALYAQGRTTPGKIVTQAKGGSSYHNYGTAFDFALLYDKDGNGSYETLSWDTNLDADKDGIRDWQEVVKPFKALGYTWGGDWAGKLSDSPHLEKNFGLNWRDMLAKNNAGQFIPGTKYIKIP